MKILKTKKCVHHVLYISGLIMVLYSSSFLQSYPPLPLLPPSLLLLILALSLPPPFSSSSSLSFPSLSLLLLLFLILLFFFFFFFSSFVSSSSSTSSSFFSSSSFGSFSPISSSFSCSLYPLFLLPLSPFPHLPLPPLLNVFYLNLSCVYSFCFALLNFTCLRVAVCLSMFLLIKLFSNIIKRCTTRTRYPDPAGMITGYWKHWCTHKMH